MTSRRLWLAGSAATLAGPWALAEPEPEQTLVLATAPYPPFVNLPGHPRGEGIDIDIAREALRRGGGHYRLDVQMVPWRRALFMLEHGVADFTTTIARTPERDRFLDWSTAYRTRIVYRFYSRKGSKVSVRRIEDVARYRLGLSAGFFYPEPILQQAGQNVEHAKDIATVVRLLQTGRVELIVISNYAGVWEIREQGMAGQFDVQPFEHSNENSAFMAFSRSRPHAAALAAMNTGLAAMQRDGSITRMEQRYLR